MMKVAHIFKALDAGGIERWLTDLAIQNRSSKKYDLHFIVQKKERGFFESHLKRGDVTFRRLSIAKGYVSYIIALYKELVTGKFDVVHSHVHHFNGIVLLLGFLAGIKIRISHCHNDKRQQYKTVGYIKKSYLLCSKVLIKLFSNRCIAVSPEAAVSLYGGIDKVTMMPCGIYLDDNIKMDKKEFGGVFAHVGSFTPQKNHKFLIDVFECLQKNTKKELRLKLIGGGPLTEEVREYCKRKKKINGVEFLGLRSDVGAILSAEVDAIIMPSLHEGLSLSVVEAQYYGVPIVVSDRISLFHKLSDYIEFAPIDNPSSFAQTVFELASRRPSHKSILAARDFIKNSALSVEKNIEILSLIYDDKSYFFNFYQQ